MFRGSYWHQKYFTKTLANLFENIYNKCGAGLQPGIYFTRSFIFQYFFYTLGTAIFRNIWECLLFNILLQCVKQEFTLFISLFLQKIKLPVLDSNKLVTFNSNWKTQHNRTHHIHKKPVFSGASFTTGSLRDSEERYISDLPC